ncbi:hypothetical protein D3C77_549880 [compost metagenome]
MLSVMPVSVKAPVPMSGSGRLRLALTPEGSNGVIVAPSICGIMAFNASVMNCSSGASSSFSPSKSNLSSPCSLKLRLASRSVTIGLSFSDSWKSALSAAAVRCQRVPSFATLRSLSAMKCGLIRRSLTGPRSNSVAGSSNCLLIDTLAQARSLSLSKPCCSLIHSNS